MNPMEAVGTALAVFLTLMILSDLIEDTAVYRLAASLLVGLSIGYFTAVMLWNVLIPQWRALPAAEDPARRAFLLLQLGLGLLVLAKGVPRLGILGDLGLAIAPGGGPGDRRGGGAVRDHRGLRWPRGRARGSPWGWRRRCSRCWPPSSTARRRGPLP
jgi:hypothetical protein